MAATENAGEREARDAWIEQKTNLVTSGTKYARIGMMQFLSSFKLVRPQPDQYTFLTRMHCLVETRSAKPIFNSCLIKAAKPHIADWRPA